MKQFVRNPKGFTLIELLIVIVIMGSLAPTFYRFFNEGFKKGVAPTGEFRTLRDTRILFKIMKGDLDHVQKLPVSFNKFHQDESTLILETLGLNERLRVLSTPNASGPGKGNNHVVVYRVNGKNEFVRETFQNGQIIQTLALLGHLDSVKLQLGPGKAGGPAWVQITLVPKKPYRALQSIKVLNRVFSVRRTA